jgi:peptidoglycan/LPS O-acetylase OafA/YrhL
VEAFFYLLFPFLLLFFMRRSQPQLFLAAAASWLVSLALSISYVFLKPDHLATVDADVLMAFWLNALKFSPLARLPEFLLGMSCGFLFLRSRRGSPLALPLVLAGIGAVAVVVHFSALIPYPVLHTALLAPAFAALVYGFALRPRWGTFMDNKLLVLCGDGSYSLYLLHTTIIGIYFHKMTGELRNEGPIGVLVFVLLATGISALVYRLIEEPARRKLNPKRKQQLGQLEPQPPPQAVPA